MAIVLYPYVDGRCKRWDISLGALNVCRFQNAVNMSLWEAPIDVACNPAVQ